MKKGRHLTELFCLGGTGYALIEILWRGFTHWSMFITGGLVFIGLGIIEENLKNKIFLVRCLTGTLFVTLAELFVGIWVNITLKLNVWDYSEEFGNILGQICIRYSFYWFLICIIAMPASYTVSKQLAYYKKIRYNQIYGKKPKKGFGIYAYCFRYWKQSCENWNSLRGRNSVCRLDSNRRKTDKRAVCMSNSRCSSALQCADKSNQRCSAMLSSASGDNNCSTSYKTTNRNNAS